MANFGNTSVSPETGNVPTNTSIWGIEITTDANWNRVDSATARLYKGGGLGNPYYEYAIYSARSTSKPGTVLAISNFGSLSTTTVSSKTLNFTGVNQIILAPNTKYWLTVRSSPTGIAGCFHATTTGGSGYIDALVTSQPAWPITDRDYPSVTTGTNALEVYVTTTAVSAPKTGGAMVMFS